MAENVERGGGYLLLSKHAATSAGPHGYLLMGGSENETSVRKNLGYAVFSNKAQSMAGHGYVLYSLADGGLRKSVGYALLAPFYPPYEDIRLNASFIEEQFPTCVSFGSSGGPGFKTSVFEFDSGFTAAEIEWEQIRAKYEVTFENATPADIDEIETFFYGMRGRAMGFRYKDWSDYQIANQNVFIGDGVTRSFQLFKRYTSGQYTYDRIIKKPISASAEISVDDVVQIYNGDFFVNSVTGAITFPSPPALGAIVRIDYIEFDVPVRFDTDSLDVSYDDFHQLSTDSIPLVEVIV